MGTLSLKSTGQGQDKLAEFFDTFCPGRRQEKLAERWYSWQAVAPHQLLRVGGVEIALQHFVDDDGGLVFRNDLRVELAVVSQKNCFLERITEELLPRNPERVGEQHDGRSEEHTSELQSRQYLVCRLLLEKTKKDLSCS